MINGAEIQPSMYISDYHWVNRSWKERLFTLPWRPLDRTKRVHSPTVIQLGDTYFVSPQTFSGIVDHQIIVDIKK